MVKKRKQQEIHMRVFNDDAKLVERMKKRCKLVDISYNLLILRLLAKNEHDIGDVNELFMKEKVK